MKRIGFAFLFLCLTVAFVARPARAQTETVVYSYASYAGSGLTSDSKGNFYGTTISQVPFGGEGYGTVFELSPNGTGGWNVTVLHSFTGGADGAGPNCTVIFDSAGNLYGTAQQGGANGDGGVFELSPVGAGWGETVLYTFTGGTDGAGPFGPVIFDGAGNLYGTAQQGEDGVVFELIPTSGGWTEQVIYYPSGADNSVDPDLTMDAAGNIYGTASSSVFELSPNGDGSWNPAVLHTFTGGPHGTNPEDGWIPSGTLVFDHAGNLYGTTQRGGACRLGCEGLGTVYKLSPGENGQWTEKILRHFGGGKKDGDGPNAGILLDAAGNIYGTTAAGGAYDDGTVFELVAAVGTGAYKEKILWNFNGTDGSYPDSSLIWDGEGILYGTTGSGGSSGLGVVFEVTGVTPATATTLTSSPNPSTYGHPVTFTAVVTSIAGAPPDGEAVSFMKAKTVLGTGTLSGGSASFTTSTLKVGTTSVTAVYVGDSNFYGSKSNTVKQVVHKAEEAGTSGPMAACWTTTSLSSSGSPSSIIDSVTFTAQVDLVTYCRGNQTFCGEQSVDFYDRRTLIGSSYVNDSCVATISASLTAGSHPITATLIPPSGWQQSSGHFTQIVDKFPTTTTLASSQDPSVYKQSVTFTAMVTAATGVAPTGRLKFMDGVTTIGAATLDANGVATMTKKFLSLGTDSITAEYMSDSFYAPSTSAVLSQAVNPDSTTTTVASSINPSLLGHTVTFTATVTSSTGAAPTGTVTFTAGTATLGTVTLSGVHAKISTAALPEGATTITATYNGSADFSGSFGSLTQTVN